MIELKQFEELINNAKALAEKCENYKKELSNRMMESDEVIYDDFIGTIFMYMKYYREITGKYPYTMFSTGYGQKSIGEINQIKLDYFASNLIIEFNGRHWDCMHTNGYWDAVTYDGKINMQKVNLIHEHMKSFSEHKNEFIEYFQKMIINEMSRRQKSLAGKIDEYERMVTK